MSAPARDGSVTRRAHAKINVFLRVLGRRDDGFHDMETLVIPISLHDVVTAEPADGHRGGVGMNLHGVWSAEPIDDHENLASIAADRFSSAVSPDRGGGRAVRITVDKHIPIAGGLGGGSADAAATLLALNELWGCGLTPTELSDIGAEIGSDVPAMLAGEPVLARGRGELVAPVHAVTTWWVLKAFDLAVLATDTYAWWDAEGSTGPDPGALIAAMETGDVDLLGSALFNDLQAPVIERHPQVGETIEAFLSAGALGAVVSGSGPTVVALARHIGHADRLAEAVPGSIVVGPPEPGAPTPLAP